MADILRPYGIMLNGAPMGLIKRNARLELDVPSNPFVVQATIDWCSSLPLDVPAGDAPLTLRVSNTYGIWKANWAIKHAADTYLTLDLVAP
ncbi:hypothetical protein [Actibacterium sp. 188UL27-1]|uniref:hypothetical protein n=1 Tax=Actibacterium sp. 188UL27-1 TaxID=2786961 RepID=UPI00195E78D9|nr:hypothetical protein [Actibacterium sp. 188UL27-1]MBM7066106.1 hypothetical protein [Actibacterium sp. 188UL27-1]